MEGRGRVWNPQGPRRKKHLRQKKPVKRLGNTQGQDPEGDFCLQQRVPDGEVSIGF